MKTLYEEKQAVTRRQITLLEVESTETDVEEGAPGAGEVGWEVSVQGGQSFGFTKWKDFWRSVAP